ncbi:hypothetical protein Poli38472_007429 [Pythium oligandrum]|uniref:Ion transport domain-containing protein n=1 Tax=Pythium oligandrum TaxID=41045 RepID=A0A8K1FQB0_PYTOL|nr:hypothetical protein Poli38472_007429 [Pythium oligandrum]|eukprot:TMW67757.1 hypothetical protein Poli38472_007429 [Pythium oligandrum]
MLHAMDEASAERYEAKEPVRILDVDTDDFRPPSTGLSPRRQARQQQRAQEQMRPQLSMRSDYDDDASGDDYEPERKQSPKNVISDDDLDDDRFRVNGIVVDQEIVGGARPNWESVYQVLFQSSTPNGQRMALALLIMVSASVTVAVLDSVKTMREDFGDYLLGLEIFFTVIFSIEYLLRILCLRHPEAFALSMLGLIDICALVPTYLGLCIPSARPLVHLAVLRIFRVMRVFRVLRLARFVDASAALSDNIQANKRRIAVFLVGLFTMILVIGCAIYLIEGDRHGFSNIPISLYWTVVTITTVGYGDIAPETLLGRMLATVVMFAGYGIIACPLVLNQTGHQDVLTEVTECPRCFRRLHQEDANFCRVCGAALRRPRAKTVKARQRHHLRLAKLRTPAPIMQPISSTTSTTKSNMRLLNDDMDPDRTTVNL